MSHDADTPAPSTASPDTNSCMWCGGRGLVDAPAPKDPGYDDVGRVVPCPKCDGGRKPSTASPDSRPKNVGTIAHIDSNKLVLAGLVTDLLAAPPDSRPADDVAGLKPTHLLDWLSDGYTHCQHGTKDWCEAYLKGASEYIVRMEAALSRLRAEVDEIRAILAATDIVSLPDDYPTVRMAHDRMERIGKAR